MSKIISVFKSVFNAQFEEALRLTPRKGIEHLGEFDRNVEAACRMTALLAAAKVAKRELPRNAEGNVDQVMSLMRRVGIRFMPSLHSDYRPEVWLLPATAYVVGDPYGDQIRGEKQEDPFAVEPDFEVMNADEEAEFDSLNDEIAALERHMQAEPDLMAA